MGCHVSHAFYLCHQRLTRLWTHGGLFNGTICIPQIIAAVIGGTLLSMVGSVQSHMMFVAGISLLLGAAAVSLIKDVKD